MHKRVQHYNMAWLYLFTSLFTIWCLPPDVRYLAWAPILMCAGNTYYSETTE